MLPLLKLLDPRLSHPALSHLLQPRVLIKYLVNPNFGLFYYLALPALADAARRCRREAACRFALVCFVLPYLFFDFGSTSLTSYQPIWKFDRFLTILSLPAALALALAAERLLWGGTGARGAHWRRIITSLLLALYLATSLGLLVAVKLNRVRQVETETAAFDFIRRARRSPVIYVTQAQWAQKGRALLRLGQPCPHTFRDLQKTPVGAIHQAWVILDTSLFADYVTDFRVSWADFDPALRQIPMRLPAGWQLAKTGARPVPFRYNRPADPPAPVYVLYVP